MDFKGRSGNYVRQPTGYSAFIPKDLPPDPDLQVDSEMQSLLSRADRALGRLDGSIQTLPNTDLFVMMYIRKEAVLSSQIEGTKASLNDLLKAEAEIYDHEIPKDVDEVVNYINAMNHGMRRLSELPLSVRLIREIHEKLLHGVRGHKLQPGELRRSQNWIGPGGSSLHSASFVPPPHEVAAQALSNLEKFLHEDDHIPPLIKIGLAHAQFETIHPFLDGNGRVGRLLIAFFLYEQKLLLSPVLYLSHYFKAHRQEYYDRLQATRVNGDWESWIKFFLTGVGDVAEQATETAREIVSLREQHRSIISDRFGNSAGKANRILEYLYRRPMVSINAVRDELGISYPNASALVDKFVSNGLLIEITGQARNRKFFYAPYINLFSNL
ncbi:Fic family protein [Phyllobacterium zundukense]|uniref:Cell filamentation protein Fic n=1 Tax=Phyllobacterium zundukense TaxID=1867719 RepID=A0A2N9W2Y1_9HYPH|nr:Fic family protein [Phyllobacterium zundukense]ATU94215.1 cell filamentation protein Fic [Phyllobacterium zundukense]PIO46099.1 cell filamentation protein Fic [Phyllobacterium zundukense]